MPALAARNRGSQSRIFLSEGQVLRYFSNPAVILCLTFSFFGSKAQSIVEPTHRDIIYATVDGKDLKLDLYLPAGRSHPMLLVWIHGGAWHKGSKDFVPKLFVENGIATASLDFRASTRLFGRRQMQKRQGK